MVYGQPGYHPTDPYPAVPVPQVGMDILHNANEFFDVGTNEYNGAAVDPARGLICGARASAVGATVRIFNLSRNDPNTNWFADVTPLAEVDGLGRMVTLAEVDKAADLVIVHAGDQLAVAYSTDGRGGIERRDRSGAIRGAGEVIEHLLEQMGVRLDLDVGELASMDRFLLDFYVQEQTRPWEVIQSRILPLLMVTPVWTARGLRMIQWRLRVGPQDAEAVIDPARGALRVSPVTYSDAARLVNRIGIEYARRYDTGLYTQRLVYDAAADASDPAVQANPIAAASQSIYGEVLEGEMLQGEVIHDGATAGAILDDQIQVRSQLRRLVSYRLPQAYQHLRVGSVVAWVDAELAVETTMCWVVEVPRQPGAGVFTFETIPSFLAEAAGR